MNLKRCKNKKALRNQRFFRLLFHLSHKDVLKFVQRFHRVAWGNTLIHTCTCGVQPACFNAKVVTTQDIRMQVVTHHQDTRLTWVTHLRHRVLKDA